ncbi:hypothetical protein ACFSQ3_13130 [Sphingobacterium corticis]|uniref:Uncharacterized protein n=1 Tax=Sphingobacterium corticis TaxID=1812823 RepID=A0ABW5NP97_9SPHI
MIRVLFIALVCIMITSCGIFRKSKRSEKSLEKVESTKNVNVKTDLTAIETGNLKVNERSVTTSDGKTKVYPSKGSQVTIAPDGTITAEADSITQHTKRHTDAARDMVGQVAKELQQKKDSVDQETNSQQSESAKKESESDPSFLAVWGNWIGFGCAIVIVLIFISWKFGNVRKTT